MRNPERGNNNNPPFGHDDDSNSYVMVSNANQPFRGEVLLPQPPALNPSDLPLPCHDVIIDPELF